MRKLLLISFFIFIFSMIIAAPIIDGNLSDPEYIQIATGNGQGTWGMNIIAVYYYPDAINQVLYLGIEGNLDQFSNNGIGFWLGFDEYISGVIPGATALGGTPGAGHYMGPTGNTSFHSDFEVDHMFAINTGATTHSVYLDAVKFATGTGTAQYIGSCDQVGTMAIGPGSNGIFNQNTINFACINPPNPLEGFEISFPYSELGNGVTPAGFMKAFTFVVSSSSFFSQDCAPGNPPTGDPGFNVDYFTLPGGPYNSGDIDQDEPLPVTLSGFSAAFVDGTPTLYWTTEDEENNAGWNIYRGMESDAMANDQTIQLNVELIPGAGTTNQPTTYEYTDIRFVDSGETYWYWLESVDTEGVTEVFLPTSLTIPEGSAPPNPQAFGLYQNYPNPFNPATSIKFQLPEDTNGELTIYSIKGEKIRTLHSGEISANEIMNFIWDGKNTSGKEVASGIYFYKLITPEKEYSRKMLLAK